MKKEANRFKCINSKTRFILIFVLLFIFISLMVISSNKLFLKPLDYRMFADMNELGKIDSYVINDIGDENDDRLNGMNYEEKYAKQIQFNGKVFYLYAYKFTNRFDAQKYCLNVKSEINKDKFYRFSYNENRLVAFYKEYAYCVVGEDYDSFVEFYNYLVKDFSIDLLVDE